MNSTMLPFKTITGIIFLVLAATSDVGAEVEWVKLRTESGETIRAIYGVPDKEGEYPAVIYNHGTIVRKLGYQEASNRGYDVKKFIDALVENGFIASAPIRQHGRLLIRPGAGEKPDIEGGSPREWSDAIKEGLRVTNAAIEFLKQQPNVNTERIGIIGFSEGGLVTLWSAFNRRELRATVLMSPANIGQSAQFRFKEAVKRLEAINAPILLTLGRLDTRKIIDNCTERLIPRMNQLNKDIEHKIDYPGNHRWFWKVRAEYWKDIIGFLNKHLR